MEIKKAGLLPLVARKAQELVDACAKKGITIIVTQGIRTNAQQDALYAQGRTKPGKVVTNAKAGQSIHNYGVAFDIAVIEKGVITWGNLAAYNKVGAIGRSIGLSWGGDWIGFKDLPHFELSMGKTWQDFANKKIDYKIYN